MERKGVTSTGGRGEGERRREGEGRRRGEDAQVQVPSKTI
jgi:hypothetical protein